MLTNYRTIGPSNTGTTELLAVAIGSRQVAAALLDDFGSIAGIAQAEPAELAAVPGLGLARATRLHAALHLGRRATHHRKKRAVTDAHQAHRLLAPGLRGLDHEQMHALFLNRRRHPIAQRVISVGSDGFTVVDPRCIYRIAVRLGAQGVILAHNHPSGDPRPSSQDLDVTQRVAAAGEMLGVPLLDHLVVTDATFTSLAERGELRARRSFRAAERI